MRVIRARNVHSALPAGLALLAEIGVPTPSRAGNCITAPCPVTTVYERPCERVLFWAERDANPFFHMMEALWMMAGRNDLAFVQQFVRRFAAFSDDGRTLGGAYGHRWRQHWGFDQIKRVVELMRREPNTRRAVVTMFDPARDLRADEASRDICCNLSVMFRNNFGLRDEPNRLDMTVTCRSNDIIWGAYGANAVHFSVLQEYVAAHLGLAVGNYYQVSNNWHAYEDVYNKTYRGDLRKTWPVSPYASGEVAPYPMIQDPATWDRDLLLFLEDPHSYGYTNKWFAVCAKPMWFSHMAYRARNYANALEITEQIAATDWRRATREWLLRRQDRAA